MALLGTFLSIHFVSDDRARLILSYGAGLVGCPMVLTKGTHILTEHLKAHLEAHEEVTPAIYRLSAQK